jgi:two-component system response regulator PrrA
MPKRETDASRPLILLIDDDEDFRETTRTMLSRLGYTVETAADGDAALDALERELPAIVLLDIFMPGMDGFAFLTRLRESAVYVPVLVTSGAISDGAADPMVSAALALGADGALRKPFRTADIQSLITQVAPAIGRAAVIGNA